MGVERIDYGKCTSCGMCYDICPMDVFRKVGKIVFIRYPRDCMTCFLCEDCCPRNAIYVDPKRAKPVPLPY